jgi:hypothetical protein
LLYLANIHNFIFHKTGVILVRKYNNWKLMSDTFLWKKNSECFKIKSEQVRNDHFEKGVNGFSYFLIDFQLLYFLTRIIPVLWKIKLWIFAKSVVHWIYEFMKQIGNNTKNHIIHEIWNPSASELLWNQENIQFCLAVLQVQVQVKYKYKYKSSTSTSTSQVQVKYKYQ